MQKLRVSQGSGKLAGIKSINTNPLTNKFCQKQHGRGTVCDNCYSRRMLQTFRKNCVPAFESNSRLLSEPISPDYLPRFKAGDFVRFHSHGELINLKHLLNFLLICDLSPDASFSLFTKRTNLIYAYEINFPVNLTLVYSNPIINSLKTPPSCFHLSFNVITKGSDLIENCRGKCRDCLVCFGNNRRLLTGGAVIEVIR